MFSTKELTEIIEIEIQKRSRQIVSTLPVELYNPVEYAMEKGGKRLRPVLLLHSYNLFSEDISNAIPAGIGIEVFHNFTLLHDDIMDNAGMRRNRPTVHKKFGENSAILSGDAMAFLAYKYLLECKSERITNVVQLFTKTAIEVCEGQQYDMDFESRLDVSEPEYLEMIRLKTAVLLACSLKAGALLANAPEETSEQLYNVGLNLGLAFQLQDDLLDSFGNQETFGKNIGGDILANKKTYLLVKTLEMASKEHLENLKGWLNKKEFIRAEKIAAVKTIYSESRIQELTKRKIDQYYQESSKILNQLNLSNAQKRPIKLLSEKLLKRAY